jgi:ferric-dicitrate binding protein FerR (iron transport regulator)
MQRLADTDREWEKLEAKILSRKQIRLAPFLKYAALIALVLSLPFVVYKVAFSPNDPNREAFTTVVSGKDSRLLELPDGTKVWLNACSSLSYNTGLPSERVVKLSGEAYFEVIKEAHRPFIVSTGLLDIKVLGTKFNLRAFEDDGQVQATLYEGSISANTASQSFGQDVLLRPGEQLTYGKDKTVVIALVKGTDDIKWREGIFHFNKQKLQNIAHSLERRFDIKINIADDALAQEEFTCEFSQSETITDILDVLKMTHKLDYSISGSTVNIVPKK